MGTGGQTAPKRRSARTPSRRVRITPAITPGRPTSTTTRSRTSSTLRCSPAASVNRSRRRLLDTISPRTRPTVSSTSLTSVAWPHTSVPVARPFRRPAPSQPLQPHQAVRPCLLFSRVTPQRPTRPRSHRWLSVSRRGRLRAMCLWRHSRSTASRSRSRPRAGSRSRRLPVSQTRSSIPTTTWREAPSRPATAGRCRL